MSDVAAVWGDDVIADAIEAVLSDVYGTVSRVRADKRPQLSSVTMIIGQLAGILDANGLPENFLYRAGTFINVIDPHSDYDRALCSAVQVYEEPLVDVGLALLLDTHRATLDDWLVSDTAVLVSCLLYTSPSPRDATLSRMPSSA